MQKYLKTISLAALMLIGAVSASSSKCYGVAFSSGDESVAYQVGVLTGLVQNLPADEV